MSLLPHCGTEKANTAGKLVEGNCKRSVKSLTLATDCIVS